MKKATFFTVLIQALQLALPSRIYSQADVADELFTKQFEYNTLSDFQRKIFDDFVLEELPQGIPVATTLNEKSGTRNKMRLAEALCFRNQKGDFENAMVIMRWVFSMQNTDLANERYGGFKGAVNDKTYDDNMREFIGTDLITIYEKFKNKFSAVFKKEIETCLILTAKGDIKRNVNPDYNNIAIMSSFMQDYVGAKFNMPDMQVAGLQKARKIYANFQKYNTLCEYNSPTYYGVDFTGLAMWRELSVSPQFKEMGKVLEKELWLDLSQFYNANLQNICGPYLRSYGMDMKKYTAIAGVWIAAAVDDPRIATVPAKEGPHNESNFIVCVFDLGISMPKKALEQFKHFTAPRFLSRTTSNYYEGDRLKKVTAYIQSKWMMGGLWGNRKVSHILRTATMHWRSSGNDIGWLMVPGEGKTNVVVDEKQMKIYLADTSAKTFEIMVYANAKLPKNFKEDRWDLDTMQINVTTTMHRINAEVMDKESVQDNVETTVYYPYMFKITYQIPPNWDVKQPLIILTPQY